MSYREPLNTEQKRIYDRLVNGENIFLTGNAGTGKSFLVSAYNEYCEENGVKLLKAAPTGIAACNIKGVTLHKLFGLKTDVESMLKEVKEIPESVEKTLNLASALLIDEISMVRIDVFDKIMKYVMLENEIRRGKKRKELQLIFVGDFFQLAPVIPFNDKERLNLHYGCDIGQGFAFQSKYWRSLNVQFEKLTEIVRQDDANFCKALDQCKYGDTDCLEFFGTKTAQKPDKNAVWVCGKNATAAEKNKKKLSEIKRKEYVSNAVYSGQATKSDKLCEDTFVYKKGARVIMLINDTNGAFQNGSMGTIESVETKETDYYINKNGEEKSKIITGIHVKIDNGNSVFVERHSFSKYEYKETEIIDIVKNERGEEEIKKHTELVLKEIGSAEQYPMKLGYAITVHKAQGQTYEAMNFMPEIFQDGQLYVALSRCKTADKIYISSKLNKHMVRTSKEVVDYYKNPDNYSFFGKENDIITIRTEQKNELLVKSMLNSLEKHRDEIKDFFTQLSLKDKVDSNGSGQWGRGA